MTVALRCSPLGLSSRPVSGDGGEDLYGFAVVIRALRRRSQRWGARALPCLGCGRAAGYGERQRPIRDAARSLPPGLAAAWCAARKNLKSIFIILKYGWDRGNCPMRAWRRDGRGARRNTSHEGRYRMTTQKKTTTKAAPEQPKKARQQRLSDARGDTSQATKARETDAASAASLPASTNQLAATEESPKPSPRPTGSQRRSSVLWTRQPRYWARRVRR
jgi:hypothetical protein